MDTADVRRAPIPTFRQPARLLDPPAEGLTVHQPVQQPATATTGTRPADPGSPADAGGGLYEPPSPRPDRNGTRTATSDSTGEPAPKVSTKDTAVLVAGLLGLAVAGLAVLVRLRRGATLRRPTKQELDDVAAPLARLALAHVPAGILNADLANLAAAGAATGAYLSNGPLIEHPYTDPGLPADLQEEPA